MFIMLYVLPNDGHLMSQNMLLFVPFKNIYVVFDELLSWFLS
jgi:hypothetical protein